MITCYQAIWPDGYHVVWRNLTWKEYNQLKPEWDRRIFADPISVYLEVYRLCKVRGPEIGVIAAGIVNWIGKHQMIGNPFNGEFQTITKAIQIARLEVSNTFLLGAQAIIASAFKISLEEMDTWDSETFFRRLAQAEIVMGRAVEPGNPAEDPKLKARKQKRPLNKSQELVLERMRSR